SDPRPDRPVARGRTDACAVGPERGTDDLARVPSTGGDERTLGRVPQARRPVLAARGQPRAVRAEGKSPGAAGCVADRRSPAGSGLEHPELLALAFLPAARPSLAVRAHDNATRLRAPRDLHATKDPTGLIMQDQASVADPCHHVEPAASLRCVDQSRALAAKRQGPGLAAFQVSETQAGGG